MFDPIGMKSEGEGDPSPALSQIYLGNKNKIPIYKKGIPSQTTHGLFL